MPFEHLGVDFAEDQLLGESFSAPTAICVVVRRAAARRVTPNRMKAIAFARVKLMSTEHEALRRTMEARRPQRGQSTVDPSASAATADPRSRS